MADNTCDLCGAKLKNAHGVTMHKSLVHGTSKRKSASKRIVLKEVYTDGGENGRILLTDQNGNWWVARMLDV